MEKLTKYSSWAIGLMLFAILLYILGDILTVAWQHMTWSFLWETPYSGGRKGGIFPIVVSSSWILLVCLALVIPVGTGAALYLSEYGDQNSKILIFSRKSIEILASVPSIVFGLFGNAIFCVFLGFGFSILSGGLTLALMALPLYISTVESGFRSVPSSYKLASEALGISKATMIWKIVIPCALPSVLVGIVLSIGRAMAETAALIFTSGYVDRMPESFLDSGRSLSIHIYDLSMNVPGGDLNAYKTSFVLVTFILVSNAITNSALNFWSRRRFSV